LNPRSHALAPHKETHYQLHALASAVAAACIFCLIRHLIRPTTMQLMLQNFGTIYLIAACFLLLLPLLQMGQVP